MKYVTKLIPTAILVMLISAPVLANSAKGLKYGALEIKKDAIGLFLKSKRMAEAENDSFLPVLASAILALEQTIDRAEAADQYLTEHEDELFLVEFTKACSKIAIARGRLFRAKLMLSKEPNDYINAEDLEVLREDIVSLRDAVDCPS